MKVTNEPNLLSILTSSNGGNANISEEQDKANGFGDLLKQSISAVNKRLVEAEDLGNRLAMGEHVDIARVMSEMAKADISFRLLLQVRNKALNAYEEIMRMQF